MCVHHLPVVSFEAKDKRSNNLRCKKKMRKIIEPQLELGQTPISEIKINLGIHGPRKMDGLEERHQQYQDQTDYLSLLL